MVEPDASPATSPANAPDAGLPLPVPSADDRTNAMLVYILAIFSGFIAPLVFFLVKRDSRFVVFHSLQVLIWYAAYMIIFGIGMIAVFCVMFFSIAMHPHPEPGEPPFAFFGVFGLVWLWGMGGGLLNLILGIIFGIKANQGEWARLPIVGSFVLRRIMPHQQVS